MGANVKTHTTMMIARGTKAALDVLKLKGETPGDVVTRLIKDKYRLKAIEGILLPALAKKLSKLPKAKK